MAELSKVVGALLRDIAHSRVMSDIFSRDASVEYEKDALLRLFPVPRVEIKEAKIDLSFAVNKVEPRKVGTAEVFGPAINASAKRFGAVALDKVLEKHKDPQGVLKLVSMKHPRLEEALEKALAETAKKSDAELKGALRNRYGAFRKKIYKTFSERFFEDKDVKDALMKGTTMPKLRRKFAALANEFGKDLISRIKSAQKEAEESLSVDVAVTKEELAELPETMISKLTLVVETRNYEWTQVNEVEGQPIRHLTEK